ncbi:E3 ubiquitin-protein ligase UHRF1-like [Oratosquilla oratoria]|uniref:E3 ubiquitin-protein ligase UHRF1-like n=1 Tax=Oratosquilla oratoria TaxID=337810 RepID=UPI003F76470B
MYVKVRTMDGSQSAVLTISKLTNVEAFRVMVEEKFQVEPDRQRLFYRGKQMENGHSLFDYNINVNDVIQLMIKAQPQGSNTKVMHPKKSVKETKVRSNSDKENVQSNSQTKDERTSAFYHIGDLVDAKDLYDGTWWEAKIVDITSNPEVKFVDAVEDGMLYHVVYERYEDEAPSAIRLKHIRPRAHTIFKLNELRPGMLALVNYNLENPEERGFWYDCEVKKVPNSKEKKKLVVTIFVGAEETPMEDCHIKFVNEIMKIEKNVKLTEREDIHLETQGSPVKRKNAPNCSHCKDLPQRRCKECGCYECGKKDSPDKQIMCDECDMAFHIYCLSPPLESIPDVEEWYCPHCKNDDSEIVKAGEKLKTSKKKAKMPSAKGTSRDWGKGFACAGRQKVCTIVPNDHCGPIPGVEVGMLWKFRMQVSEAGVHRPPVGGIHGRDNCGAYSIVLSGGYEDDEDFGDSFTYTGSGGRDLSGNKRTAEQSCDQLLTRMNRALALNCNVPLNEEGGEASEWKNGKPVRVVRNFKGHKHSKYAPEDGNRYDGIYKVVKYWKEKGKSGFSVWRYLLRRDDPTPAPWTKKGKERIAELGLCMQYPDGYLEAMQEKQGSGSDNEDSKKRKKNAYSKEKEENQIAGGPPKKKKKGSYTIEDDIMAAIEKDNQNAKMWNECLEFVDLGKSQFLSQVEDRFLCICCQEVVCKPVTTSCLHNVCYACLLRSFKAEVYFCPACRHELGNSYEMKVNTSLSKALLLLFPGYDAGR